MNRKLNSSGIAPSTFVKVNLDTWGDLNDASLKAHDRREATYAGHRGDRRFKRATGGIRKVG